MQRLLAPILLLCLVALHPAPAAAADDGVTLTDRATPSTVTVDVGEPLTIRNDDDERHRMRAREPEDVDSSDIDPGGSAVLRFPVAGRYVLTDERTDDPAYELAVEVRDGAATPAPTGSDGPASGGAPSGGAGGAASGGAAGGAASAAPSSATVTIPDRVFSPRRVTVAAGGTVTWDNRDGTHTVTAEDRSWDSGLFDDGGSFRHTFRAPGTYDYLCLLHPEMTGTVEVLASDGSTPPPPARPEGGDASASAPPPASAGASPEATSGGRPAPAAAGASSVAIRDFAFAPATLRVAPGSSVTWTNRGAAVHNVASVGDGPLGSAILEPGDTYRTRFDEPGTFDYRCDLHPAMTGRVVVTADAPAPDDAADAADAASPGAAASEPERSPAAPASSAAPVSSAAGSRGDAASSGAAADTGRGLAPVAAVMLLSMGAAFVVGRVTADP